MGGGSDTSTLSFSEIFFDLNESLCKRYEALTPFVVRREKVGEVFKLVNRINRKNEREKGVQQNDVVWQDSKGNTHIRRKATDDSWY